MHVVEERPDAVDASGVVFKQRPRVKKVFTKPSMTRQEFKQECDLALTLKRFAKTPGGARALANAQGFAEGLQFCDVTQVPQYRQYRDLVNAANAKFMALPVNLRRRFENDPAQFMDFVADSRNREEALALGLIRPEAKQPVKAEDSASSTPPVKG